MTAAGGGVRYMLAAAFFFSLMSLQVKLAGREMSSTQIVFARCLFSLVVTWLMLRGSGVSAWGVRRGLLILRGLLGFAGLLCFFYAITKLPLADVTVIHFTNPVFTALLATLFLKERMRPAEVAGLLLSLLGVVLVARPTLLFGSGEALPAWPVAVALFGALCAAGAYTTVRKLGQSEHHLVVVFYFPLVATPASLPLMAGHATWPSPVGWLLLLGVGAATQAAQVYLTRGLHAERAGRAMSLSYVQIVFAAIWGLLVFGERPDPWTVAGAALVVAGALTTGGRLRRRRPAPAS